MFCLNCISATDTVISLYRGRFYARCAKNTSLYQEYRHIEDRYIGVLSHTFYCNVCRDIAYLSLYRIYRYTARIVVSGFHCIRVFELMYRAGLSFYL